jgi:hypothetical protein
MSRTPRRTTIRWTEIRTAALGLTAAGLALFVSITGPVRIIAGVVGAASLVVMLWPRDAQSEATSEPQKDQ